MSKLTRPHFPHNNVKRNPHDFIGKVYKMLTVVNTCKDIKYVVVKCECGNVKDILIGSLVSENTISCGCLRLINLKKSVVKHSKTGTLIYQLWQHIKSRCYKETNKDYSNYGGRGIYMDNSWKNDFSLFDEWCVNNGWQNGLQIDRIDNNKGYYPSNCHFVTNIINAQNKRNNIFFSYKGNKKTLRYWSEKYGVPYTVLSERIRLKGMNIEEAIFTPSRYKGRWVTPIQEL